ncbi:MAG TPA: MBL fold metallo-hydrolase [Gemmatimonadales bacterium]|nr:MBL fold metallo-hydrolase [Gemmatimonadales bacterium]
MSRITTLTVGSLTIHALEAGIQQLDGGAMFGVVPKPLWQRRITPDERNRIPLAMRPLLVEHPDGLLLIDSGLGNKESEKFHDIYGVENAGADGRTALEDAIREAGHAPDDIKIVLSTHLHFDHAGGNTYIPADDPARRVVPSFPNARYIAHRREFEYATQTNERTAASYLPHNWEVLQERGMLETIDGTAGTIVPGVRMMVTPGHTPWHMVVVIGDGGERLLYPADTVPTAHHLPLPWIMGYDVEPLRTLESKRALYPQAVADGWRVVFEHDADTVGGRLVQGDRGVELGEVVARP